jgi:hemoglobin
VCDVEGGPFEYVGTKPRHYTISLEEAHRDLEISSGEVDAAAAELGRSLDFFNVPRLEKEQVMAAFAAHKAEVREGSLSAAR